MRGCGAAVRIQNHSGSDELLIIFSALFSLVGDIFFTVSHLEMVNKYKADRI